MGWYRHCDLARAELGECRYRLRSGCDRQASRQADKQAGRQTGYSAHTGTSLSRKLRPADPVCLCLHSAQSGYLLQSLGGKGLVTVSESGLVDESGQLPPLQGSQWGVVGRPLDVVVTYWKPIGHGEQNVAPPLAMNPGGQSKHSAAPA